MWLLMNNRQLTNGGHVMDRRVRKTREALEQAFLAMERQQPVNEITVAALTTLADVGRGTFYLHYQDVADLQRQVISARVSVFMTQFTTQAPPLINGTYQDWLASLVAALEQQRALFAMIRRSPQAGPVRDQIVTGFCQVIAGPPLAVQYTVNGGVGVAASWLAGTLEVPAAQLVAFLDHQLQSLTTA
jgi:AcrR family transcriptional regulator